MKKIKLLIITDEMEVGGTQRQIVHLLNNINRDLFDASLVYFRNSSFLVDELKANDISTLEITKNHKFDPVFIYKLYRYIKDGEFDIVHCFALSAEFWGALCFSMANRGHLVTSIRGQYEWYTPLQWRIKKEITKRSTKVISNSKNAGLYSYNKMKLQSDNLHVIYNGIKFNTLDKRYDIDVDKIFSSYNVVAMFIGRLIALKNIPTLIKAFKKVQQRNINDLCLIIVGDGPDRNDLNEMVNTLDVKNVHFLGERNDVPALLEYANLVISPSLREGLSNTILEAMEAGVPVIASNVGGSPEIITNNENGILFNCDDVEALEKAIISLYYDKDYSKKLGHLAREDIHTRFSIPAMVDNFEKTYTSIVNR